MQNGLSLKKMKRKLVSQKNNYVYNPVSVSASVPPYVEDNSALIINEVRKLRVYHLYGDMLENCVYRLEWAYPYLLVGKNKCCCS